ncbi:FecR family protein [Roseivirga pacifica]|uniref:FecR family protein n=1 Tax=Roseivirga pacifica TaxID=1267423 RepID=A0A1I0QGY1_9BACT|nr:FecR domain-containing protein [Roseivirga pacifica]RKQ42920.1 FecR family protein [Roseivirga pacifica]SEW26396.1 FecR family protein [Roseivirga pacifica]
MKSEEFNRILHRVVSKSASKQESEIYETFYEELQKTDYTVDEKEREIIWFRIQKSMSLPKVKVVKWPAQLYRVAAALVLIATFGLVISKVLNNKSHFVEGEAFYAEEILELKLPDGSSVVLNEGSSLTYSDGFGLDNRNLSLEGEAFFNVERNEQLPFKIKSGELTTTVLGTSFNVMAYRGEVAKVTVVSGKVNVKNADRELVLTPNEQAIIVDGGLTKQKNVNASMFSSWKDGRLIIPDLPVDEAFNRIGRHFDVQVRFGHSTNNYKGCLLHGSFEATESMDAILEGLSFAYPGLQYEFTEGSILITSFSCD